MTFPFSSAIAFVKIGGVEVAAALTRHQRMGHITLAERNQLYANFTRDAEYRYVTLPVTDELLVLAAELTQRHLLRGYDAVHLAGALKLKKQLAAAHLLDVAFVSADEMLCDAARVEGLIAQNPNSYWEELTAPKKENAECRNAR